MTAQRKTRGKTRPNPENRAYRGTPAAVAHLRDHGEEPPYAAQPGDPDEARFYQRSASLLGGRKYWPRPVASRSEVHEAIVGGVAWGSLLHLREQVKTLEEADIARVLGISPRTLRRQYSAPQKPMPADLASRAWLFAETLARAGETFGSRERAEEWLAAPAMGLDGHRPIELLQTVQGAELVHDFLGRLEHGVYT